MMNSCVRTYIHMSRYVAIRKSETILGLNHRIYMT